MSPNWGRIYENPAEGIGAIVIQSISIILLCSLVIHFIMVSIVANWKLPQNKRNKHAKNIQILCITCFIFSIAYCFCNLLFHIIITFGKNNIECKYRTWTIYLLFGQRVCLYWFYIERLKITFKHSILKIKEIYIICLYILSFITTLISTIFIYYYQFNKCTDNIQSIHIIPGLINDIFWCLFLSIWFVFKLQQSIIEFQNDGQINKKFVFLMCKLTNIIIWSSLILQWILWIFGYFTGWIISAVTIDVVVTCCALLFTFNPYKKLYSNYICCLCHQCIIKWCSIKLTGHLKKKITHNKQIKKLNEIQMQQHNDHNDDNVDDDEKPDSPLVAKMAQHIATDKENCDENDALNEPYHD